MKMTKYHCVFKIYPFQPGTIKRGQNQLVIVNPDNQQFNPKQYLVQKKRSSDKKRGMCCNGSFNSINMWKLKVKVHCSRLRAQLG